MKDNINFDMDAALKALCEGVGTGRSPRVVMTR